MRGTAISEPLNPDMPGHSRSLTRVIIELLPSMAVVAKFSSNSTPAIHPSPSSLLEATPASIVRALSVAYPLLCFADKCLGWLTWSSSDRFESCLVLILFGLLVRHADSVMRYFMPLTIAVVVSILLDQSQFRNPQRSGKASPTLDEIVSKLESSGSRFRKFMAPVKNLKLSGMETMRFLLATTLFSPVYVLVGYLWLTPQRFVLVLGLITLSWHSVPSKVLRSVLWRIPLVRLLVFIITGIDRTSPSSCKSRKNKAIAIAGELKTSESDANSISSESSQEIEYTFELYENQRHWLGIGWTANLLPEERAAWTDSLLNEAASIDTFKLPDASGTGMSWAWVDSQWMLDVAGDGSVLESAPDDNEGFVYYNSLWSSPSPISGILKYTRRRKWLRRATLVSVAAPASDRLKDEFLDRHCAGIKIQ